MYVRKHFLTEVWKVKNVHKLLIYTDHLWINNKGPYKKYTEHYLSVPVQGTTRKLYWPLVITVAHQAIIIPIAAWIKECMSCCGWRIFPISASLEQGMEGTTENKRQDCGFIILRI